MYEQNLPTYDTVNFINVQHFLAQKCVFFLCFQIYSAAGLLELFCIFSFPSSCLLLFFLMFCGHYNELDYFTLVFLNSEIKVLMTSTMFKGFFSLSNSMLTLLLHCQYLLAILAFNSSQSRQTHRTLTKGGAVGEPPT